MSDAVLVTGGAGYIGSHVSKALADSGLTPICYDTLEKGHEWAVRWGPLERGDIGDAARLDEVFARHKPRAIIHMAGYAEVGELVRQPERYMHNNVTKTGVLVEAALRHGIEAFVFSSSCSVYGLPQSDLLDEKHPIAPMSPYAELKARAEVLLAAAATRGLRAVSLRYFNAAGADAGGDIGEAHAPETHLLPLAADAALGLGPPLTLLGDDYPTPDGSCVRDYIHVTDLADAHVRALGWLEQAACARRARNLQPRLRLRLQRAPGGGRDRAHCRQPRAAQRRPAPTRRFAPAGRRYHQGQARTGMAADTRPLGPDRGHAALAPEDAALDLTPKLLGARWRCLELHRLRFYSSRRRARSACSTGYVA